MEHFPQLSTGTIAQYPIVKMRHHRISLASGVDGRQWKLGDAAAGGQTWRLTLQGLTQEEWDAVEDLFVTCAGRLRPFTFLDPFDNLLAHSEDLGEAVWQADPMLGLNSGSSDPMGTHRATTITNAGQTPQSIRQTLSVPSGLTYCLSLYVRSGQSTPVTLRVSAPGGVAEKIVAAGGDWQRLSLTAALGAQGETVTFGLELGAGAIVDVFGLQAEAQPGASLYKKTMGSSGVHSDARFLRDELTVQADGVNSFSSVIEIRSPDKE